MIKILPSEHVFVCGITGSGKTTLMKNLYAKIPAGHAVVVDVKNELNLLGAVTVREPRNINEILSKGSNVLFKMQPDRLALDALARYVFARGNTALIVDEAALTLPAGQLPPGSLQLITAGRSRRATLWALCQRPANVDKSIISQCQHYFIFTLVQDHDKRAIGQNIPLSPKQIERVPMHHFYHYQVGESRPPMLF